MKRVTGIGVCSSRRRIRRRWLRGTPGISASTSRIGAARHSNGARRNPTGTGTGTIVWSPFTEDTGYFAPGTAGFMVNYRVADLHALLAALRAEGCRVEDKVEESGHGKFGWVLDPEGNKIELWQPPEGS